MPNQHVNGIAVVGAGYVGLATAVVISDWGYRVHCFDRDESKVRLLNAGVPTILEPLLPELLRAQVAGGNLTFSSHTDVSHARVVFICIGTPPDTDGGAQLADLLDAVHAIGKTMQPGVTVVVKSTVPVGTCDQVEELLARYDPSRTFSVLSNPEFLRQGSVIDDTKRPDRIVIGARHPREAEVLARIYEPADAPVQVYDRRTAELTKYAANAFLAARLSLINEISHIAEYVGADVTRVAEAIGMDRRIGRHFLKAGIGYGGSCLPKDLSALRHFANAADCLTPLLDAVSEVNHQQPRRFVARIESVLGGLNGKKVGLLGLTFKPQTSDIRGSKALDVIDLLEAKGAHVRAYDPVAMPEAAARLTNGTYLAAEAYDACIDVHAVVIATEWPEFAHLDWPRIRELVREPYIFDGRNLLKPAQVRSMGFSYYGIGRNGSAEHFQEGRARKIAARQTLSSGHWAS